jgi:hypothetical protein
MLWLQLLLSVHTRAGPSPFLAHAPQHAPLSHKHIHRERDPTLPSSSPSWHTAWVRMCVCVCMCACSIQWRWRTEYCGLAPDSSITLTQLLSLASLGWYDFSLALAAPPTTHT